MKLKWWGVGVALWLLGAWGAAAQKRATKAEKAARKKVEWAMRWIEKYYVEPLEEGELGEVAIRAMVEALDPHSVYLSKEEAKKRSELLAQEWVGIGVRLCVVKDTLVVREVMKGGGAEKAGLRLLDKIVEVDGVKVSGPQKRGGSERLRGSEGEKVRLGVRRGEKQALIGLKVVRKRMKNSWVKAAYLLDKGVGYVKLGAFGKEAAKEVRRAIRRLKKEGMRVLVLDLQGNGGGYLAEACGVLDELLPKGAVEVSTKGRGLGERVWKAKGKGEWREGGLCVVVDEASASASEVVAGAVQDHGRGVIVGRRTWGKGLVQREVRLADGAVLHLTMAKYFTPSGRCIQRPYVRGKRKEYWEGSGEGRKGREGGIVPDLGVEKRTKEGWRKGEWERMMLGHADWREGVRKEGWTPSRWMAVGRVPREWVEVIGEGEGEREKNRGEELAREMKGELMGELWGEEWEWRWRNGQDEGVKRARRWANDWLKKELKGGGKKREKVGGEGGV